MTNEQTPTWPEGASADYVASRMELARAERRLRDQIEQVAAARRQLPPGAVMADYPFREGPPDLGRDAPVRQTRLSGLFGRHDHLVTYHLMFHPEHDQACPMCSMWVDGLHGVAHHLAQHAGFAVVARAPLPALRDWARRRGWDGLRILSSFETTFNADLRVETAAGEQTPAVSVFSRDGDAIRHSYTLPADLIDGAERGIDQLCAVWGVLDLLPTGRGDWYAGNSYAGRERG